MMKTVTVNEFVKAVQGQNIEIYDFEVAAGITVSMSKVRVELYAPENEVIFTSGNHVTDGLGSLSIKEELIDCIDFDEEENSDEDNEEDAYDESYEDEDDEEGGEDNYDDEEEESEHNYDDDEDDSEEDEEDYEDEDSDNEYDEDDESEDVQNKIGI